SRVYVANIGVKDFLDPLPASISVIDTADDTVVATFPLASPPRDIALSPDGGVLYLSGPGVTELDPATGDVVRSFAAPTGWLAVDPGGGMLYVADEELSFVDLRRETVTGSVHIGVAPQDIAIDGGGHRLYVSSTGENPNQPPDEVTVVAPRREKV